MRPTIINVYLVDCHGAWTLVDTGMNTNESVATLEDAFRHRYPGFRSANDDQAVSAAA